ncbi:MAG: 50S ribosomal protein L29 [Candidatus Berkelbacteria bacterium]
MKRLEEIKKFREMTLEAKQAEMLVAKKKLAQTRLKVAAGKMANFSEVKKLKKSVSLLYTLINENAAE